MTHTAASSLAFPFSVAVALALCVMACGEPDPTLDQNGWAFVDPNLDMGEVSPRLDAGPALDDGPVDRDLPSPQPDLSRADMAPSDLGPEEMAPPLDMVDGRLLTGAPCESGSVCRGGACLGEIGDDDPDDLLLWDEGYCSERGCLEGQNCAQSGGTCVEDEALALTTFCAQPCNPNPQPGFRSCRANYICRAASGDLEGPTYCLPQPEIKPPLSAADGEACEDDQGCTGGSCILDIDGWPDGYCTTLDCDTREDCARDNGEDNRCYRNPDGPNLCVRICQSDTECRTGYICQAIGGGQGLCAPDPSEPLTIDFTTYPIAVTCAPPTDPAQSTHQISFNVSAQASSYSITTLARDGRQIASRDTVRPSGMVIDYLQGGNAYQNATAQLFGFVSPMMTPAKPEFSTQLEAGAHQHNLYVRSQDVCHYYLEESTPGATIDLNIYLVGVSGLSAASAPSDANMQATLSFFSSIYSSLGVTIGKKRYYDITGAPLQQYRIIRDERDVGDLVALSELPGQTIDDALSVNVFFVQAFALGGGAIGISQGLPGPPGLHGTRASGVVFTSEFLGQAFNDPSTGQFTDGNDYTGVVLAHELGHYLGLFHTTEQFGQGSDPLTDTPVCQPNQFPDSCPDLNNLMFPFAGVTHTQVSADQSFVLGVNPLTKD